MLTVWAVAGLGEILEGDDLAVLIGDRFDGDHPHFAGQVLTDGDIVAVTSKIVSKAESRARQATDREEAISEETEEVAAMAGNGSES